MTWKPTSNVVITAISIVPSFSDAETTELSGLISSLHKARGGVSMGQAFSLPDFSVFSVFLSSYFILLHSTFCSHQLLLWESTVEEKLFQHWNLNLWSLWFHLDEEVQANRLWWCSLLAGASPRRSVAAGLRNEAVKEDCPHRFQKIILAIWANCSPPVPLISKCLLLGKALYF